MMMRDSVHARALQRAAEVLGGKDELRKFLGATTPELDEWMTGVATPPTDVFLRVVDVITAAGSDPLEVSKTPRPSVKPSVFAQERALAIRRTLNAHKAADRSASAKRRSALEFLQARFEPREGVQMVDAALDAAIGATGAAMGNLQLREPDGLHIVAQHGFRQPFLDYFACVNDAHCACGLAMARGQRIVVPDVAADPLFAGTPSGEVILTAGALAVQSTPLLSGDGELIGVLSTHYPAPHEITAREHDVLDHIARRTAFWLDGGRL